MSIEEKVALIARSLGLDEKELNEATILETLDEWDSTGIVSIMAMLNTIFGKLISPQQIQSFVTVGDILNLMVRE